jgi:hypothetical protein
MAKLKISLPSWVLDFAHMMITYLAICLAIMLFIIFPIQTRRDISQYDDCIL